MYDNLIDSDEMPYAVEIEGARWVMRGLWLDMLPNQSVIRDHDSEEEGAGEVCRRSAADGSAPSRRTPAPAARSSPARPSPASCSTNPKAIHPEGITRHDHHYHPHPRGRNPGRGHE